MSGQGVLRRASDGMLMFYCPGCKHYHGVWVLSPVPFRGAQWQWNGSMDRPTFSPSILVNPSNDQSSGPRCHSFVRDGQIEFLSDCSHELAGKTVPLELED